MKWISDDALRRLGARGPGGQPEGRPAEPDLAGTRYELGERLGRGGMGAVYSVTDRELEREVALKVLNVEDPTGELRDRLLREARVLARLEHPGIVPIHDAGTLADGRVFYVMKRVRGQRLDQVIGGEESLARRLRHFLRICEAVAFAHEQGVIHRDLKPQNIMVGAFGEVLVLDWGVAKVLPSGTTPSGVGADADAEAVTVHTRPIGDSTRHGAVLGTPGYMAPEQAAGNAAAVTARSDVHALGAVLRDLVRGSMANAPTQSVDDPGTAFESTTWDASLRGTPRPLRAIIERAMHPDPRHRYAGAKQLADDVERYLEERSVTAYPEPKWRKGGRFLWKHKVAVVLLLAYVVARGIALLFL